MKKIISIFLLATYLLSTTQVAEIFKLPLLVVHFLEHNHHQHHLEFSEFLHEHYAHDTKHSSDHNEDSKLPFKSPCTFATTAIALYTFPLVLSLPKIILNSEVENTPIHISTHYLTAFHSSIWQPPKNI